MRKGKVSLVTPCYNGQAFTQLYIKNILCQNHPKVEVIFVNDGSSDNIEAMISEIRDAVLSKGYEFVYLSKENGGAASAVNMALKYVTGDYLMLLDMDDELFEDAISAKAEYLDSHPEIDTVISNGYYVFEDKRRRMRPFLRETMVDTSRVFEGILKTTFYNWPGSYMVRCDSFWEINEGREIFQSPYGQNMQILLPATYKGKIYFINQHHMKYFVRKQSASHMADKSEQLIWARGYENIRETVIKKICHEEQEQMYYMHMIREASARQQIRHACMNGNRQEMETQYNRLKKLNALTLRDAVVYFCGENFLLRLVYKGVRYMERFLNQRS